MSQSVKNRPKYEIRRGRVRVSVWESDPRTREDGTVFVKQTARVELRYLDSESGEWRSTNHFDRDELLALSEAAREASAYIYSHRVEGREDPDLEV